MIPAARRRPTSVYVVLVRGDREVARWPFASPVCPDLELVERLARLQLAAMRMDCTVFVHDATPAFVGLLDLTGLAGVLGPRLRQVGGEAEEGEQRCVEEVVVPDDPVA